MHDLEEMNSVCKYFHWKRDVDNLTQQLLDMSTIPDPKPARICMAVGGLGAGAKVCY